MHRPAGLDRGDLLHPPVVPATRVLGCEESRDCFPRHLGTNDAPAEAEHVGFVVLASKSRRRHVVNDSRAHASDLVGGNADANPGAADAQTEVGPPGGHSLSHSSAVRGVVDGVLGVRSHVVDQVPELGQVGGQHLLEGKAGMVGADGYAHDRSIPTPGGADRA